MSVCLYIQWNIAAAAAAKSLQSCPTLCDPIDGSPPGFTIPGILQARTLEWVAISFSNTGKWKVKVMSLSRVRLLQTQWTAAHQAPPSMGFSRQEYWSGVPLPSSNEILVIHKKEIIILKSESKRYDITCMWNLKKKAYKSTYLQNKNKTIDIEKKLTVTKDERGRQRDKLGVWD